MTVGGPRIASRRWGVGRRRRRSAPRDGAPLTAEAVWAQISALPAGERPALLRAYVAKLAPHQRARLLALSEAAARREVLARLARRDAEPRRLSAGTSR